MNGYPYPEILSDGQWEVVKGCIPAPSKRGRPAVDRRLVLTAILYVVITGCPWRNLPRDLPAWKTVYTVFWRWRHSGVWQQIHDRLRQQLREQAGRKPQPSAVVVDSQSVKTTAVGGGERGFDAAKKVKGRKRHLAVDTLGLIWAVVVHAASVQDQAGAWPVLERLRRVGRRLQVIFADAAYRRQGLVERVKEVFGWILHTIVRPLRLGRFEVLPKRWIVERTFAWLAHYRRHRCDYERNPRTSEVMILIAMIHLMSKRLAHTQTTRKRI